MCLLFSHALLNIQVPCSTKRDVEGASANQIIIMGCQVIAIMYSCTCCLSKIYDFLQGTLKDSLERYLLYGLEENTSYDVEFKNEIDDVIKLVSAFFAISALSCIYLELCGGV